MFPLLALVLIQAAGVMSAGAKEGTPDAAPGEIRWAGSFESALEEAAIEGRIVMVDFYTSWCGWCKRLDRDTYVDPRVVERSRGIVSVKVDAERRKEIADRYRVRAYPTIGFVRSDGTEIQMVRGYQGPEAFANLLDRLLDTKGEEFTLRQRLRDHPELAAARHDLASILLRRGDYAGGLSQLDSLLTSGDGLDEVAKWDLRLTRCRTLLRLGRAKEARGDLEKFVKKRKDSPRLAEAVFYLGEVAAATGDRGKARKWFRRLLELRQDGWLVEQSRARLADLG